MLTGLSALLLQMVWTRQLCVMLGGSTYALTSTLVVILLGIGLGIILGRHGRNQFQRGLGGQGGLERRIGCEWIGGDHGERRHVRQRRRERRGRRGHEQRRQRWNRFELRRRSTTQRLEHVRGRRQLRLVRSGLDERRLRAELWTV